MPVTYMTKCVAEERRRQGGRGGKRETMAQGEEGNAKKELELRDENKKF